MPLLAESERAELLTRWQEPHRHYHDRRHLDECLALLASHRAVARDAEAVEAALWLHDAVCDSRRHDNEVASAALARQLLVARGIDKPRIARVEAMILATTHAALSADPDVRLVCDIDLAILGASPERFAEYERDIHREYAWVPEAVYRSTRAEILGRFLARPAIYQVPTLSALYETRARENLTASIATLGSGMIRS